VIRVRDELSQRIAKRNAIKHEASKHKNGVS
jgi:hypothetical protein